jgi:hypothetical protein
MNNAAFAQMVRVPKGKYHQLIRAKEQSTITPHWQLKQNRDAFVEELGRHQGPSRQHSEERKRQHNMSRMEILHRLQMGVCN